MSKMTGEDLNACEIDVLGTLEFATRNSIDVEPKKEGWVRPRDCGGSNGSRHSYTLTKLAKLGYADARSWGGWSRGSKRYRINSQGKLMLCWERAKRKRK